MSPRTPVLSSMRAKLEVRCLAILAFSIAASVPHLARTERVQVGITNAAPESEGKCTKPGRALVQSRRQLFASSLPAMQTTPTKRGDSCARLVNKGTHFTVRVAVGNPPQNFDVVTDTGSNNLIVRSCNCKKAGGCSKEQGKCFKGTNHSSTFQCKERPPIVAMSFGSGTIVAAIATDDVQVGSTTATMKNSLLLMIERELDISGPFEGILGLGLPTPPPRNSSNDENSNIEEGEEIMVNRASEGDDVQVKGFMELSGTTSFSVCFNDGEDGVLRLDPPAPSSWLGSIGQAHWGLDLRGVTVQGKTLDMKVEICSREHMKPGQDTACGAIPDSGTTVVMAPSAHVKKLFNGMCKAWPKCQAKVEKGGSKPYEVFQELIYECHDWLGDAAAIGTNAGDALNSELPSIEMEVVDAAGIHTKLTLDPADYVIELDESNLYSVTQHLVGIFPTNLLATPSRKDKVCMPAFGGIEFNTRRNGPVWIVGTPIFYKYQVAYNLASTPPGMAFLEEKCGTCNNNAMLMSHKSESSVLLGKRTQHRGIRQVNGPWRVSNIDLSKGL